MQQALKQLVHERRVDADALRAALRQIMQGQADPIETAALLTALHMKGETADDIAAGVSVLREVMTPFDAGGADVLDTCGTGGDGSQTFNISTATAFVVAAAGVPVVKHGNRGVSSASGSADVLAELGLGLDADLPLLRRAFAETGLAFCFAPRFHPAVRHAAEVRKRLGFRTLFNQLGPLANPAGARFQLIGVGRPEWLDPMAGALARLGVANAYLVHGAGGLDEVSLAGPTQVRHVRGSDVQPLTWAPADFGLSERSVAELRASGPGESAACIRGVLAGRPGPARDIVLANTAAALLAAGRVACLLDGVVRAAAAIDRGHAQAVLQRWTELSQQTRS